MPNGGRLGDNPQSWFMDALCRGDETYLGDPIDSLACEIYRVSKYEFAAGIYPDDKKNEIDPVVLEAKLRETLAREKEKRIQRIEVWANSTTTSENISMPDHVIEVARDTVRYAMNYGKGLIMNDPGDASQIDELMDALDAIPARFTYWHDNDLKVTRHVLSSFDHKKWKGAPDFVAYLESAVERFKM